MPKFDVVQSTLKVAEIRAVNQSAADHAVKVGIRKGTYEEDASAVEVVESEVIAVFDGAALEIGAPLGWTGD
jgi:hypothetical protein